MDGTTNYDDLKFWLQWSYRILSIPVLAALLSIWITWKQGGPMKPYVMFIIIIGFTAFYSEILRGTIRRINNGEFDSPKAAEKGKDAFLISCVWCLMLGTVSVSYLLRRLGVV